MNDSWHSDRCLNVGLLWVRGAHRRVTANLSPQKFYRAVPQSPPQNVVFIPPDPFTVSPAIQNGPLTGCCSIHFVVAAAPRLEISLGLTARCSSILLEAAKMSCKVRRSSSSAVTR